MTTNKRETERFGNLPTENPASVQDPLSFVAEGCTNSALETMIASEAVLARDWNWPEEEEAWVDL
jgi:hypothetical protein